MPAETGLVLSVRDRVALLSVHNPPENRLTRPMVHALADRVAELEKRDDVHAVVVSGDGPTFCAGLDAQEWAALSPKDAQTEIQRGFEALWALEHLSKPTIAAIEGACHSLGAELALACDLRLAADSATFAFPEIDRSWMPSHGGAARLPRIVGRSRALQILLSGTPITAEEAAGIGLVDRCVPTGEAANEAWGMARTLAAKPRDAVRAVKRVLVEGEEKPYRNRFLLESQYAVQLLWSKAYQEAQERVRRGES